MTQIHYTVCVHVQRERLNVRKSRIYLDLGKAYSNYRGYAKAGDENSISYGHRVVKQCCKSLLALLRKIKYPKTVIRINIK